MKKILSLSVAAVMVLSSLLTSAAASTASSEPKVVSTSQTTGTDKALEKAILTVKSRVNIPDEYANFTFNKNTSYGQTSYQLNWEKTGGDYSSINISVKDDVILSYYKYDSVEQSDNTAHFAKLSNDVLYNKASAYLEQYNPAVYSSLEVVKDSYSSYIGGTGVTFQIIRKENGIKVDGDGGSITLNKDTGIINSLNLSWAANLKLDDPAKVLTQKQIQEQYTKKIGLTPVYSITTDENGVKKAKLLYRTHPTNNLDAFTGDYSKFEANYNGNYGTRDTAEAAMDDEGAVSGGGEAKLTPAELKAVETEKGLINSGDAAKAIFDDEYNAINTDTMELTSSNLYNNQYNNDSFSWSLSFRDKKDNNRSANATVNANTGEIINFSVYSYIPYETAVQYKQEFNQKASDENVANALKKYLGDKTNGYVLRELSDSVAYSPLRNSASQKDIKTGQNYNYVRFVNDIEAEGDNISVSTDINGLLTNFYYNYSDISFPKPDKILSLEKAHAKLYAVQELELGYYLNITSKGAITSALIYTMPSTTLDAITGKQVNRDGSEVVKNGSYSDIENHKIKAVAEKLAQNGITLPAENGKLMPDSKISEVDFINLVSRISTDWNDFYNLYQKKVYNQPRLTIAQRAGAGSATSSLKASITRQEAVKCMIIALSGKKFAELKGVYASPFKDVAKNSDYAGYFALANGMGIVKANSAGNVLPTNTITRAQALAMVYNYLNSNSK